MRRTQRTRQTTRSSLQPKKSTRILKSLILLGFIVLLFRLIQLQILDYNTYAPLSMKNSLRMEVIQASRGIIMDRNQKILVENTPVYAITVTPSLFDAETIPLLAQLTGFPETQIEEKLQQARAYSWHRTSILFQEVSFDIFSAIEENIWRLPGIGNQIGSRRNYPGQVLAPHIFGYLREASPEDLNQNNDLQMGDQVGRSGLELTYENDLRGQKGARYIRVNAFGASLGEFPVDDMDRDPVRGAHLITTLDAELQKLGETLMEGKTGSIVALDPNTGEVLSLVSAPQFDPEKLSSTTDPDYWQQVNSDSLTPLFNRAISSRQPPGSTFKPFMGLFGIDLNLITPRTEIVSTGAYIRGRAYGDTAEPGVYDLEEALAKSSNYYFFWMMERIATRGHLNRWSEKMKDFGMGEKTGIDLPFERSGIMPDSTWMNQTFGERKWGVGDLMSLGIGQGMVSVSPLQMAVATSVLANGGYVVKPYVVKEVQYDGASPVVTVPQRERVDWLRESDVQAVRAGMRRVVTDGGGRFYANIPDIAVAGKTGTAQNPHGRDHGWFVSFAPADDPEIVVAVLMENAGFGSISAAPVAALMIEQYLTGTIERERVLEYVMNFDAAEIEARRAQREQEAAEARESSGADISETPGNSGAGTSGAGTSGTDTSGTDTSGTDTSGTDTSGTDTSGASAGEAEAASETSETGDHIQEEGGPL